MDGINITKKTITIGGQRLEYFNELGVLSYDITNPISEKDANNLIKTTISLFDKIGLRFALAYGTLLGAIRDHGLIKGDEDVDILIWEENILWNNLVFLYNKGFKVIRVVRGEYYSFRLNENSYIDVYVLRNLKFSPWQFTCYSLSNYYTPKKLFTGYHYIEFLGQKCLCPNNPEKLLEFWYGSDWRTPKKGHDFYYEVKSAYYWHKLKKPLKKYVKKIIFWDYWGYPLKCFILGRER